jgi:hypothetical protein
LAARGHHRKKSNADSALVSPKSTEKEELLEGEIQRLKGAMAMVSVKGGEGGKGESYMYED